MKKITLRRLIDNYLKDMFDERSVKMGQRTLKYRSPRVITDYVTSESDKSRRTQMISNKSPLMYELKQIIKAYDKTLTDYVIDGWSKVGHKHYDYDLAKEMARFKEAQEAWLTEALTSGTNNYGIAFRLKAAHDWNENFSANESQDQLEAKIEVIEAKVLEVKDVNEKDTDSA